MKQPNDWTCYPTCLSSLTGIPLKYIMHAVGHDGTHEGQIIAYDYNEMVMAMDKLGWIIQEVAAHLDSPCWHYHHDDIIKLWLPKVYLIVVRGSGMHHCIAWNGYWHDPLTGKEMVWDGYKIKTIGRVIKK